MNKLEHLQHQFGVNGVFMVDSWSQYNSEYFRYYVPKLHQFFVGFSTNLNVENMKCKTVMNGLAEGLLDEKTTREDLIDLHKSHLSYQLNNGDFTHSIGKFLSGQNRAFANFNFNGLPVVLESGDIVSLHSVYKSGTRVFAEVSNDIETFQIPTARIASLVDPDKVQKEFLAWQNDRIDNAKMKDLCSMIDIRVTRFIKTVLCK